MNIEIPGIMACRIHSLNTQILSMPLQCKGVIQNRFHAMCDANNEDLNTRAIKCCWP